MGSYVVRRWEGGDCQGKLDRKLTEIKYAQTGDVVAVQVAGHENVQKDLRR